MVEYLMKKNISHNLLMFPFPGFDHFPYVRKVMLIRKVNSSKILLNYSQFFMLSGLCIEMIENLRCYLKSIN